MNCKNKVSNSQNGYSLNPWVCFFILIPYTHSRIITKILVKEDVMGMIMDSKTHLLVGLKYN